MIVVMKKVGDDDDGDEEVSDDGDGDEEMDDDDNDDNGDTEPWW